MLVETHALSALRTSIAVASRALHEERAHCTPIILALNGGQRCLVSRPMVINPVSSGECVRQVKGHVASDASASVRMKRLPQYWHLISLYRKIASEHQLSVGNSA